jgi:CHAT domain-containing protein
MKSPCELSGNMITTFVKSLSTKHLPNTYVPVLGALAELSCSPWKFDVLWEVWPELLPNPADFSQLAHQLLPSGSSQADGLFGTVVFDDLTIFYDIVGGNPLSLPGSRMAYRLAYLSVRQIVCRSAVDAPPDHPFPITEEQYLQRLAMVAALTPRTLVPEIQSILDKAKERYQERGNPIGAALCDQNRKILGHMDASGLTKNGVRGVTQQAFQLMMSTNHVALASEIVLQWWPLYGADFHTRLIATKSGDSETVEAINGLGEMFSRLAPFAWVNEQRPGIGSAMATLAFVRLNYQLEPPSSLLTFRSSWLEACQECIIWLRDNWTMGPPVPTKLLHGLLDYFVQVGHDSRHIPVGPIEQTRGFLESDTIVMGNVMVMARLRARNELSSSDYAQRLEEYGADVAAYPLSVELILMTAEHLLDSDPALSAALFEAAENLARWSRNPNLMEQVKTTIHGRTDPERQAELAERCERQGRPDLAVLAWHNSGASLLNAGQFEPAMRTLAKAWTLVAKISRKESYVPRTTFFPLAESLVKIAENYSMALFRFGKYEDALAVIEKAIATINKPPNPETEQPGASDEPLSAFPEEFNKGSFVKLHIFASECLDGLRQKDAAVERLQCALELSLKYGELTTAALIHTKFAALEPRGSNKRSAHLAKAREFGEKERRLSVYEADKIKVCTSTHAAYAWAAESFLKQGLVWEALASFEGLRSRSLLDLLGLSRALEMPKSFTQDERDEGDRVLDGARAIAYPGEGEGIFGMRSHWEGSVRLIDEWLAGISAPNAQYAAVVRGETLKVEDMQDWSRSVRRATAIIYWFLGEEYSYISVLLAIPGRPPSPPTFRKIPTTLTWLNTAAAELQASVRKHKNPPGILLEELSRALFAPIADLIDQAELIYFCPTACLHSVPLGALCIDGHPLSTTKEVAVIPSFSVLKVLERFSARADRTISAPVVFGPEFPEEADRVARLLSTSVTPDIFGGDPAAPFETVTTASMLHLICHGSHDPKDPWNSGFRFKMGHRHDVVLEGRTLAAWRLRSQLCVLEACDTRRQVVSVTEDGFGIGRFLYLAGVPTVLLADWEVRSDVSQRFMRTFYEALPSPTGARVTHTIGGAYREAIRATREWAGVAETFLWAPFSLCGLVH